jgi:hypothetical protein
MGDIAAYTLNLLNTHCSLDVPVRICTVNPLKHGSLQYPKQW